MAATRSKLWLTTKRIRIINVVTFLLLSAVAVADEGNSTRKCYWCGPIAEQVHRKDVAPPCGPKNTVIYTCQEGHNYCAIAATTPPYEESRFCSKVYQDECYPQYCNSTKKWRMTCTCRGDLCNEIITKREMDAFATLPREVEAKESREKRNTKTANFVPSNNEKTVIVTNLTAKQSDEDHSNENDDDHVTQLVVPEPKLNVQIVSKDEDVVKNLPTLNENIKTKNDKDSNENEDKTKTNHQINEIKETSVKDVLLSKVELGTTKMTNTKEVPIDTNTAKPSEKLPTAEALQQEASSENDDNTEHTTTDYEPTESGTSDDDNDNNDSGEDAKVTAEPGHTGENSGKTNTVDIWLLLNGFLLQFIYYRK